MKGIGKEKIYCGFDLGSQRVKTALVKARSSRDFEILGVYEAPATGFSRGSVRDLGEFTECISRTLQKLIKQTGGRFQDVQLGIKGDLVETRHSRSVIPLVDKGSKVIGHNDVAKISRQARLLGIQMDEEMLHEFPQSYRIDESNEALNPIGLHGRKLEIDLLMVVSAMNRLNNISKAFNQAGFEVSHTALSSFVASTATLDEDLKDEGCALIDVGAHKTDVLIFKDGSLRDVLSLAWGGDRITQSISRELSLPFDLSEEIKKSYAEAATDEADLEEEILVKKEAGYLPIPKAAIARAVTPEVKEFIGRLRESVQRWNRPRRSSAPTSRTAGSC